MKTLSNLSPTIERKILHFALCLALLLPYIYEETPRVEFFAVLALFVTTINAALLKKPLITSEIKEALRERRRRLINKFAEKAPNSLAKNIQALEELLTRIEEGFEEQIRRMERSYEQRGGYIGITHGVTGVLVSEVLFGTKTLYGVLALLIIDTTSVFVAELKHPQHNLPYSWSTLEGSSAAFIVYTLTLMLLGVDFYRASIMSLALTLVEAYAPEDNLLLPPSGGLLATILGV